MATMREKIAWALAATLGLFIVAAVAGVTEGGPLDPPGPPGSTDSVRLPGTPISGLPFTASAPGHYYVTDNLSGAGGVTISADNVSIDLGGHTLSGPGSGTGILIDQTKTGATIRNGNIRNWAIGIRQLLDAVVDPDIVIEDVAVANTTGAGMQLARGARLRNCSVASAGAGGITVSSAGSSTIENCVVRGAVAAGISGFSTVRGCEVTGVTGGSGSALFVSAEGIVEDCRIHQNTVSGVVTLGASSTAQRLTIEGNIKNFAALSLGQGAVVRDSIIRGNTGGTAGISGSQAVVIENTVVETNGGIGIDVDEGAVIRANTVANNDTDGIVAGARSLIQSNAVADNGSDGIEAGSGSRILDNSVRLNGDNAAVADGTGIRLTGAGNYVTGNVLSSNDIGIRSEVAPNVIVRNSVRNSVVAHFQTLAGDITGVTVTTANEATNSVQHHNDTP